MTIPNYKKVLRILIRKNQKTQHHGNKNNIDMFKPALRAHLKKANPYASQLKAFMDFELIEIPLHTLRPTETLPTSKKLFRLEFELFGNKAPLCTENFARLCAGDMLSEKSEAMEAVHEPSFRDQFMPQLSYTKSALHKIQRDFSVQGGDVTETFVAQNEDDLRISGANRADDLNATNGIRQTLHYADGRRRERTLSREVQPTVSAFGEEFDAGGELNQVKFDTSGLLGTAVTAPHKNHSQFFILLPERGAPHLDGTCVCFGRVTKGLDELKKWQRAVRLDFEGKPLKRVQVSKCGML